MTGDHGQPVGEDLCLLAPVGPDPRGDFCVSLGKAVVTVVVRFTPNVAEVDSRPCRLQGVGGLALEQDMELADVMGGDKSESAANAVLKLCLIAREQSHKAAATAATSSA